MIKRTAGEIAVETTEQGWAYEAFPRSGLCLLCIGEAAMRRIGMTILGIALVALGVGIAYANNPPPAEEVGPEKPKAEQPVSDPEWDDPEGPNLWLVANLKCHPAAIFPGPGAGNNVKTLATTVCDTSEAGANDKAVTWAGQVAAGIINNPCKSEFCPLLVAAAASEAHCSGPDPAGCVRRRKSVVVPCYPLTALEINAATQQGSQPVWCSKIYCVYDGSTYEKTQKWRYWDCWIAGT